MRDAAHGTQAVKLRDWLGPRYLALSTLAAIGTALVLAIPADIIPNPIFSRMIPVEPEQYVFWVATSLVVGLLLGTYMEPGLREGLGGTTAGAGLLGAFAVGCPVCNKLVLVLLGSSGALNYFAPIQPLLGLAALALASWALVVRLQAVRSGSCRIIRPG